MDNIPNETVICQCLRLLDLEKYRSWFVDHRSQKLFSGAAIQLFVESQLCQRQSFDEMAEHLNANSSLQRLTGLESISASQLSRKLKALDTASLQDLFVHLVSRIQALQPEAHGLKKRIGVLHLIDSTKLTLPPILSKWAFCSQTNCGIKMHTRFVVGSPEAMYPDRIIASTQDVSDHEVVLELAVDQEATHIMDRGYPKYEHLEQWVKNKIRFVIRVKENSRLKILTTRDIPVRATRIRLDADVQLPDRDVVVRLVEFEDEQNRRYRVVTNRWDVSAQDIAQMYRNRWLIELFFKWIKQHLRLVHVYGYTEASICNQLYLALIAYAVCLIVKLEQQASQSIWKLLQLIRIYADAPWKKWMAAVNRKPSRSSKGRQKKKGRRPQVPKKSQKPKKVFSPKLG